MGKKAMEAQANGLQTIIYCTNPETGKVWVQISDGLYETYKVSFPDDHLRNLLLCLPLF